MSPTEYLSEQLPERQPIMNAIHDAIMANDKTVTPVVEPMMGKEMIIYKEATTMKYALSGVKAHISLHCLPMYMNPAIHQKYEPLLPLAKFQKGCVNFASEEAMPMDVATQLIADCARISIVAMLENRKKK
ncbi:DUF1801 domain-containing protein [Mucilaginibacter gilvus]|uniref:DUF1801 domain-containing protein n=1 Tax=Mucilaginibacter gilvus TaxID=2305909 RepID=A0A3S3XA11_9SPHI|nr:DUF1801 domain-containing protein [Mucilaginibacter gilvus]RWY53888.1 hypothetical protein EPL05_07435 [Mucilaginibacter gilvus]